MKIAILHDSQAGNGERLAAVMKEAFEQAGAEVTVAHVTRLEPDTVAAEQPDLLLLGAAIRKFHVSPPRSDGSSASTGHWRSAAPRSDTPWSF